MAQQIKSTHRGNCQVCGRLQAVRASKGFYAANQLRPNTVAKHGYTVKGWGFFMGTCPGSDKAPLQVEHTLTDATIALLTNAAQVSDQNAADYRAGTVTPAQAKTGKRVLDEKKGYYVDAVGPFAEQSEYHQQMAVAYAISREESDARYARAHAKDLTELKARIHGTALLPIIKVEAVKPAAPEVDVKAAKVTGAYATKAARQDDLERLSRQYEKLHKQIQQMYLDMDDANRSVPGRQDLYYGPHSLAHWRPKHSALCLKVFPGTEQIVLEIEQLVKTREAVKAVSWIRAQLAPTQALVASLATRHADAVVHRMNMVAGSEAHQAQMEYCDQLSLELGRAREKLAILEEIL